MLAEQNLKNIFCSDNWQKHLSAMSIYNLQKMIHNNNFSKRQIKEIIADLPLLTWSSWYLHSSMDPILLMLLKSIFHLLSNHLNFENHQSLVSSKPCSTTKFQQAVTTQEGAFFVSIKITMTTFHCLIASLWRYFCWWQKYVFISQLPRKMTAEVKTNIEKAKIGRYENLNPNWYKLRPIWQIFRYFWCRLQSRDHMFPRWSTHFSNPLPKTSVS